jgi:hypothetical protein
MCFKLGRQMQAGKPLQPGDEYALVVAGVHPSCSVAI